MKILEKTEYWNIDQNTIIVCYSSTRVNVLHTQALRPNKNSLILG